MKLKLCICAGLAIGLSLLSGSVRGQENNPATAVNSARSISESGLPGMDTKISIDLIQPMEVVDLIKFLTVKGNLNVIFGRDVTGSTKLMLK